MGRNFRSGPENLDFFMVAAPARIYLPREAHRGGSKSALTCSPKSIPGSSQVTPKLLQMLQSRFSDGASSNFLQRYEILINCMFTQWKWTYILDFGSWKWSGLNMKFVYKWPSELRAGKSFRSGPENLDFFLGAAPARIYLPREARRAASKSALTCSPKSIPGSSQVTPKLLQMLQSRFSDGASSDF